MGSALCNKIINPKLLEASLRNSLNCAQFIFYMGYIKHIEHKIYIL